MASISIQTKKFADLAEIQIAKQGDMTFIHDGKGVKKIAANNLVYVTNSDAGAHNSVYRGNYLGGNVSSAQYQEIKDGRFNDMYIGDYWTINGVNYRIAAFDYYFNSGDVGCTEHHVTIVPDSSVGNYSMNDTNTTEGGYHLSLMRVKHLPVIYNRISDIFANHILNHRILLVNAVTDGMASGSVWDNSTLELMTEGMLYGTSIHGRSVPAKTNNIGVFSGQLPLFRHRPDLTNIMKDYWLRDVSTTAAFSLSSRAGRPNIFNAASKFEVRPYFSLTGGV